MLCAEFDHLIQQGQEHLHDPANKAQISIIQGLMNQYDRKFHDIVTTMNEIKILSKDQISPLETKIVDGLTKISRDAQSRGNAAPSFYAGLALKDFLAARIALARFLLDRQQADANIVRDDLQRVEGDLVLVNLRLSLPGAKQKISQITAQTKEYIKHFETLVPLVLTIEKSWISIRETEALITDKNGVLKNRLVEAQNSIGKEIETTNHNSVVLLGIVCVIALVLIITTMIIIMRSILKQLGGEPSEITYIANQIASGNLAMGFSREVSKMQGVYRQMYEMTDKLSRMVREILQGMQFLNKASTNLSSLSSQMNEDAEDASRRSGNVSATSHKMADTVVNVAAGSKQATDSLQMIVSAAHELSNTINHIAENTSRGNEATFLAVEKAKGISEKVGQLSHAAEEISKVTDTISEISEQTNLLALNATIEAARAGEAGNGFAVVADEIKHLAQQTARATDEISLRIQGIQESTNQSVDAITEIVEMINAINDVVSSVSASIEEQSSSTQEIATAVNQAAIGGQEVTEGIDKTASSITAVNEDIARVNDASKEVQKGSTKVAQDAEALSDLAENLNTMVKQFTL